MLVVNAGSTSLKLRVVGDTDATLLANDVPLPERSQLASVLDDFLAAAPGFDAVGHRVVHGGPAFTRPVVVDAATEGALGALADLAPLHNPPALAAIDELRARRPDLPQVACFDTAFHATMPAQAATYAVPSRWREELGVRRYGFHGLSHAWAARRAAELMGRQPKGLRLVTAHLGAGASLAAVVNGRSVDTTMGFTPLDGLVMATRPGSLDPGALVWALRHGGLSVAEVEDDLEHRSGLAGLSPGSEGDLRRVVRAAERGEPEARLAYAVYLHRLRAATAAMAAALGGLDGLVFTGGVGEGSARVRADACEGLGFLGLPRLDAERPQGGDRLLTEVGQTPAVLVVESREDLEIARDVRATLAWPTP